MGVTSEAGAGSRVTVKEIEDEINNKSPPLTKVIDKGKSISGQKNVKIEGFDFRNNSGKDLQMLRVTNCQDVIIRRCKFTGTNLLDAVLNVTGPNTKRVIIEYCIFEDLTTQLSNGGEPTRLGISPDSGCRFACIVRRCIYRNNEADPETISIKSVDNVVEDCHFIKNKSMVTVRHGGYAVIHHNTFEGNNGVRLLGYGNVVRDNLFKNNSATDKMSPIQVQYGAKDKDPNWTDVKTPSDKSGSHHSNYAQCTDNVIENNEFVNCKNKIFYRKGEPLKPLNLKIIDKTPTTVPSEPPTTTTTPPPVTPETPIPPTPPVIPEPEPPTTVPQCSICGKEPVTKKITVSASVGTKHYVLVKKLLILAIQEAKIAAVAEEEQEKQGHGEGEGEGGVQQ